MHRRRINNIKIKYNTNGSNLDKKYKIAFIIPTTSNKRRIKNVNVYIFFRVFMTSFLETVSGNNIYNFYLGYDDDDNFFIKNNSEIMKKFTEITNENYSLNLIKIENLKGKVGKIWSNLADIARNEDNDYLYQIGDDVRFMTKNWDVYFIERLLFTKNIGCVGPYDVRTNAFLLTQSFVHVTHLDIFKTFFPDEIINWDIDCWITFIYGSTGDQNVVVNNGGGSERYTPVSDKNNYIKIRKRDIEILKKYLDDRNIEKEEIILSIIIKNKKSCYLQRLINSINWASGDYYKNIEIICEDNQEIKGKYVVHLNETDLISSYYFEKIFKCIKENINVINYKSIIYEQDFIEKERKINKAIVEKGIEEKHIDIDDIMLHICNNPQP